MLTYSRDLMRRKARIDRAPVSRHATAPLREEPLDQTASGLDFAADDGGANGQGAGTGVSPRNFLRPYRSSASEGSSSV